MNYERFEYKKLESIVNKYPNDEDKINYISQEILRCRNVAYDIENEFRRVELEPYKIKSTNYNLNKIIDEEFNNDRSFRNDVTEEILKTTMNKITETYYDYINRAEELKKHFSEALEIKLKVKYANGKNDSDIIMRKSTNNKVVWKSSKDKLLKLFKVLNENELCPLYKDDDVLIHFLDERRNKYTFIDKPLEPFCWQDSDNAFSVFADELAKRGAIDNTRKYKIMSEHFVNKNGEKFKSLSQKKLYTENTTNTGNIIREILDSINL